MKNAAALESRVPADFAVNKLLEDEEQATKAARP
jgi:hypothetical protein